MSSVSIAIRVTGIIPTANNGARDFARAKLSDAKLSYINYYTSAQKTVTAHRLIPFTRGYDSFPPYYVNSIFICVHEKAH